MAEPEFESVLTDEIRATIGKVAGTATFEISREAIRRWAEAIGDPNPLYQDPASPAAKRHGDLVAPPGMLGNYAFSLEGHASRAGVRGADAGAPRGPTFAMPFKFRLNGGNEIAYFNPVVAGDVITATSRLAEVQERMGRPGINRMFITISETEYRNQRGEVVARARGTGINYEGAG